MSLALRPFTRYRSCFVSSSSCRTLSNLKDTCSRRVSTGADSKCNHFYISTPIYYANGEPHLGHLYTSVSADIIARFNRLDGNEVLFVTGTDNHGQKVQQAAEKHGVSPQQFTDTMATKFQQLASTFNISYDDFIRTTQNRHKIGVQQLWRVLAGNGYIYKGVYEGWYSVRDECFYNEDELVPCQTTTGAVAEAVPIQPKYLSPISGDVVNWVAEESYFFRLSAFREKLLDHYESSPEFVRPSGKLNEIKSFVRGSSSPDDAGLRDLSISRTSFSWGIPVPVDCIIPDSSVPASDSDCISLSKPPTLPSDANHVIYVWLDALASYITALGYGNLPDAGCTTSNMMSKFWPANVHIIGKDILRFHAVFWPAFLMAANLPLPKTVFAHGWWVVNGEKMSKSIGNVVSPYDLLEVSTVGTSVGKSKKPTKMKQVTPAPVNGSDRALAFAVPPDYVRYYLAADVVFGNDGDFTPLKLKTAVNSALCNDFGNLVQRSITMLVKHCEGVIPFSREL